MKKPALGCLAAVTVLVTGCPHNEYVVELTPHGNLIERKLLFYRADGTNSAGGPNYQSFPSNELATVTALYPPGAVKGDGARYWAKGEFVWAMPGDVGGAGFCKSVSTSLGAGGFYSERFRGRDDLAAMVRERLDAANQFADLVLGWSRKQFGHEPGYKNLRRFLDVNLRRDLNNLAMYSWSGAVSATYKPEARQEFIVRFGQYLVEHGYLEEQNAPDLVAILHGRGDARLQVLIRRFVAQQLKGPTGAPMPKSLVLLADSEALGKSVDEFLAGTDVYQARLRQWQKERRSNPQLQKPEPSQVAGDLFAQLMGLNFDNFGEHPDDRLTVQLFLPSRPIHTNGNWDETRGRLLWESALEERDQAARLPVFCYASWSTPSEEFQREHFGRVILRGEELLGYCLWRSALSAEQGTDWEKLLAALEPGGELAKKLDAFRFAGTADSSGKDLIKAGLEKKP